MTATAAGTAYVIGRCDPIVGLGVVGLPGPVLGFGDAIGAATEGAAGRLTFRRRL